MRPGARHASVALHDGLSVTTGDTPFQTKLLSYTLGYTSAVRCVLPRGACWTPRGALAWRLVRGAGGVRSAGRSLRLSGAEALIICFDRFGRLVQRTLATCTAVQSDRLIGRRTPAVDGRTNGAKKDTYRGQSDRKQSHISFKDVAAAHQYTLATLARRDLQDSSAAYYYTPRADRLSMRWRAAST